MEKNTYTILIIDDHPLIVQAYKLALEEIKNTIEDIIFNIAVSHDCTTALNTINNAITHSKKIDLVLLDISLPPSEDGKILSGEDLGIKIRSLWHETKIIVSTTYSDTFRIHTIIKNINPEGFLVKNDLEPAELVQAVKTVLNGKLFFTETVLEVMRNNVAHDYFLDRVDRQLLYELSIGTKMKDLPDILPLSIAGIEKRKRNLKVIFNIKGNSDKELIQLAKEKGFI